MKSNIQPQNVHSARRDNVGSHSFSNESKTQMDSY